MESPYDGVEFIGPRPPEPWESPEAWEDWPSECAGPEYWLLLRWGMREDYTIEEL